MIGLLEGSLLVFVVASAIVTAVLRDPLGSVIAVGAYSLGIAVLWALLRAPDVGLTEAAVGAGVLTVLFLLTLANTTRPADGRTVERLDGPALVVSVLLVAVLAASVLAAPPIGGETPVATDDVTRHYLEHAHEETGVENVVTAVLAAYRGFDTLGEAVVVYAAGVGLLVVLDREWFQ